MASLNTRTNHIQRQTSRTNILPHQYFIITITNFPHLIQRTQRFQQPSYQFCPQQLQQYQNHYNQGGGGGMLIPGVPIHFGRSYSSEHERLLYNTLRFELQDRVQQYLERTQRSYPFYMLIDMSNMQSQQQQQQQQHHPSIQ